MRELAKQFQAEWAIRSKDNNPFRFIDKAGRAWENARYIQMLTRTTAQRVETAAFCDSMLVDGFPLARISNDSGNDCDVCGAWEGRLIDLTPGHQLGSGTYTLREAREAGLFHPNCTHRLEYVSVAEIPENIFAKIKDKIGIPGAFGDNKTATKPDLPTNAQRKEHIKQVEKAAEEKAKEPIDPLSPKAIEEALLQGHPLGGSTGARLITTPDGKRYVVKAGASEGHVQNEMDTDALYRAAGINVPEFRAVRSTSGRLYKVSEFVEGQDLQTWWENASAKDRKQMTAKITKGLDVDAMLGNWDVIGMSGDNILIDKDGNPWRIDNGGSMGYRAQGTKKTDDQWNQWTGDFFTITQSANNAKYVGKTSASVLFRQASARNWDKLTQGLSEADRAAVMARVKEMKEQAARAEDLATGGYTEKYADSVLKAANDLCKEGYREAVPKKIAYEDYGNCRPQPKSRFGNNETDYGAVVLAAAKTVNYHANDGAYNKVTLKKLYSKEQELQKIYAASGDAGAKHYLDAIAKIKDAVAHQTSLSKIDTSVKVKQASATHSQKSLTEMAIDYIGDKDWNDYIAQWTESQAGDSWNNFAIKRKVVEFHAMGIDAETLDEAAAEMDGVWNGVTKEGNNSRARSFKKVRGSMTEDQIERFTEIDAKMRAATMLMLENADFNGNVRDKRKVVLFRTEEEEAVFGDKKPTKKKTTDYDTSPAESFSFNATYYVYGDCAIACAVPYSRISASYFMARDKAGNDMFLGDKEKEFNVNAFELPRVFVSRGKKHHTTTEIMQDPEIMQGLGLT